MFPFQSEVDSAVDTRSMVSGSGLQLALQAGRGLMACSTDRSRWIVGALLSACALIVQDVPAHGRAFDVAAQDVYLRLEGKDAEAVNEFQRRLTEFDAVRQHLDASLPPLVVTPDRAAIIRVIAAHHGALLSARHSARQGDIFSARVADRFRDWIRASLHGIPPSVFLAMITEPDGPPIARPLVNGSYPPGAARSTMPPELLQLFPSLPAHLEYRFIDRDLILWDSHANLIIDVIPNAFGPSGQRR
jgi:hypothetical protein